MRQRVHRRRRRRIFGEPVNRIWRSATRTNGRISQTRPSGLRVPRKCWRAQRATRIYVSHVATEMRSMRRRLSAVTCRSVRSHSYFIAVDWRFRLQRFFGICMARIRIRFANYAREKNKPNTCTVRIITLCGHYLRRVDCRYLSAMFRTICAVCFLTGYIS